MKNFKYILTVSFVIALIVFNIISHKSTNFGDVSLNNLTTLNKANAEDPGTLLFWYPLPPYNCKFQGISVCVGGY